MRAVVLVACAAGVVVAGLLPRAAARPGAATPAAPSAIDARALYDRFCMACHGSTGDGRGPAAPWLWPRPRDFTRGDYKWRTTPMHTRVHTQDLQAAIGWGVPGTSMPGFDRILQPQQIAALADLVAGFATSAPSQTGSGPMAAPVPAVDAAMLARGEQAYATYGCPQCHGPALAGDGASAASLKDTEGLPAPPYDLVRLPLRRPRGDADVPGASALQAIFLSITIGIDGTPMPSYESLPEADRWAIAAWIDARRWRPERGPPLPDPTRVDPIAQKLDADGKLAHSGAWPGHGVDDTEARIFPVAPLPPQGRPPAQLGPAQRSLEARRCGRCHAEQYERWQGSVHALSAGDGFVGQLLENAGKPAFAADCQKCHAPLAEQRAGQPGFDAELRGEGVTCAGCHLRAWTRHGPPRSPGSRLLALPNYPLRESGFYERADFCLPCHQLSPRVAVAGKPLLNTYREWLEGPYMRRGVQCQHCHMSGRRHEMKGVHDAETFRQAVKLEAIAGRSARTGAVSVRARLRNVGAGHYLPTTPTPAAWITVELLDGAGRPIAGARADKRIGRKLKPVGASFAELEDTRIPPGESTELAAAWTAGRVAEARHARVTVRVHPQDFYEEFYARKLGRRLPPQVRGLYTRARANALATRFTAIERLVPIAPPEGR